MVHINDYKRQFICPLYFAIELKKDHSLERIDFYGHVGKSWYWAFCTAFPSAHSLYIPPCCLARKEAGNVSVDWIKVRVCSAHSL